MTHSEFLAVGVVVVLLVGGEVARNIADRYPAFDAEYYRARDSLFHTLSRPVVPVDTPLVVGTDSTVTSDSTASGKKHRAGDGEKPRVNLNTASTVELVTLPGIGPRLAQRIIAYRSSHGPFRNVAELERVSGIGPRKLQALTPLVRVSP